MKEAKININTSYSLCETAVKYLSHHNLCVLRLSKDADRICWKIISNVRNAHSSALCSTLHKMDGYYVHCALPLHFFKLCN